MNRQPDADGEPYAEPSRSSRPGRSSRGRSAWWRPRTGSPLAAGVAILEKGGNAFDAAGRLRPPVVEPHLCGPGGEVPVIGYDARRGEDVRRLRPGHRPGDGDPGGLPGPRARPRAGQRAARRVRAGRVRRLAPAPASTGGLPLRDVLELRDRLRRVRVPARARGQLGHRQHWPTVARALDYLGRGLPARRGIPAPGSRYANPALAAHLHPASSREAKAAGRDREDQLEAARPRLVDGFVAEAIGHFASHRGDGRHGGAAPRLPHRARPEHLARATGGARPPMTTRG